MKSITIHSLDDELDKEIRERAKNQGTSLNKTIKRLLEKALGLKSTKEPNHKDEFMDLFGIWSEEDYLEFFKSTEDFNIADPKDWK